MFHFIFINNKQSIIAHESVHQEIHIVNQKVNTHCIVGRLDDYICQPDIEKRRQLPVEWMAAFECFQ